MKKHIDKYILSLTMLIISIICLFICVSTGIKVKFTTLVLLLFGSLIPLLIPLINRLFKLKIPFTLNLFITIHLILSICFGTTLGLYNKFFGWDLLVHGLFGAIGIYAILVIFKDDRILPLILSSLTILGLGAIWELFEYTVDSVLDTDIQRVGESLRMNKLPQANTMEDLLITIISSLVFILIYLIINKISKNQKKKSLEQKY